MKTGKVLLGFSIILSFLTMCGQTKDFKLVIKIPTKSRPQQFFRRLGTDFTDGYLSRECWRGYLPIEGYEEIYNTLERETCREP